MPETPLEPFGQDLWLADGATVSFYGFPYPTRMVVARLSDGGLWLWSPIAPTPALRQAVDALGPVRHLVSPNKLHHLSLDAWHDAYPQAGLWGPRSSVEKRGDLPFEAPLEDTPPEAWAADIDQAWLRGSPLLDEVVFFHRPSRTAIFADMTENFPTAFLRAHWAPWQRWIARLWRITEPYGRAPLEVRLSFLNRAPARAAIRRVLAWDPERVVMAHGRCQDRDGRAYVEKAFAWLDP